MLNKSILLATLTAGSMCSNTGLAAVANTQTTLNINEDVQEDEPEACTVMYVGKNVSENGRALMCRSADAGPRGMNLNFKITEHNELANQIVRSQDDFEWKMPKTTYRYISTPRNVNVHKGLHWEVCSMNEMGVNVTATLSTYANTEAKLADDYVPTGLGEDNIAQIVGATATSARQGIQTVADIIDEKGACDGNTILVQDKNETWLMEIYTGHHYAAVKLPDDVACTIGNEMMLNNIAELKTTYGLKDGDYITSPNIVDFPGATFVDGIKDREHLELFNTFAEPLEDYSHMRTWRGFNMFTSLHPVYFHSGDDREKYEPFFKPDQNLTVNDVIRFMRDRYDNILAEDGQEGRPLNQNHKYFNSLAEKHQLRWVATDTAYQVHIMSINPDLPTECSCEEWICLSNSNHAPFFPLSSAIRKMNDYYTHVTEYYSYDEDSAVCIFKRLNALAETDRVHYGLPIQDLFTEQETIWQQQYKDLISQIKDMSTGKIRDFITNYTLYIEKVALLMSKLSFDELNWHIMNLSQESTDEERLFKPLMDIEYYGWIYGWDYKRKGNTVTLTQGDEKIDIDLTYSSNKQGTITKDGIQQQVALSVMDDVPYIDYKVAKDFISAGKKVANINLDDFRSPNDLVWIIPVAICVPIGVTAAILVPILIVNRKKKKRVNVLVAN